jgi:hypothetical protein
MAQITLNSSGVASNGSLLLQSNGTTTAVTIDTAQNMGLGVTPSAWGSAYYKAIEGGDGNNQSAIAFRTDSNGVELFANAFFNGTNNIYKYTGTAGFYQLAGNTHAWYNAASGTAGNTISFTQAMTLDASGNLGIGTTSPASATRLTLDYPGFVQMLMRSSGTDRISLYGDASVSAVDGKANPLAFYAGSAERARITSGGDLLVGATSTAGSAKFYSKSATNSAGAFSVTGSSLQSTPTITISKPDATNTTSQVFVTFYNGEYATGNGQINGNGANAAAFGTFSDSRLKENIVNLPSQLDNIMALRPVEYDYIESEGGGHQIGFVAQEVQSIYPDLVGERADGMLTLSDFNKNDARLIKAIQEMKSIIDTQASTITQLAARITALEKA